MRKSQLLALLRRAVLLAPGQRLIVTGSQAFHAASAFTPETVVLSEEADLLLVDAPPGLFDLLADELGMKSELMLETGTHVHPLGIGTVTLPPGWDARLVPFGRAEGLENVWALELCDLAASKLIAGREKDFAFLVVLLRAGTLEAAPLLPSPSGSALSKGSTSCVCG